MDADEKFAPLRKGLLEFAILKIVSGDRVYVADMLKRLADTSFATQEGTLYPLLSKLRREELVDYEWAESEAGPPRKYYRLTGKGERHLRALADYWREINSTLDQLGR
jgi:PadR family transcriptional regulator PadR